MINVYFETHAFASPSAIDEFTEMLNFVCSVGGPAFPQFSGVVLENDEDELLFPFDSGTSIEIQAVLTSLIDGEVGEDNIFDWSSGAVSFATLDEKHNPISIYTRAAYAGYVESDGCGCPPGTCLGDLNGPAEDTEEDELVKFLSFMDSLRPSY